MGLFEAIGELATMPIRCVGEVVKDVSSIGDFDDSEALACLFTCGLSSIGKGIVKTVDKTMDKLD